MDYSIEQKREVLAMIAEEQAEEWWGDLNDDAAAYYFTAYTDFIPSKGILDLTKEDKIKLFKIVFD